VTDGSVPYEGGRVAYRDLGGDGPAVMLTHGVGGNLAHWGLVAPLLHDRFRVIAVDLPSHGASTAPDVYSFDHDLGAVDEVRRALGLDRPALVGHSYGGMVAVALGAKRSGDYRVVVNIDGLGFALGTEGEPSLEGPPEATPEAASLNQGDDAWLDAQIAREVAEAAAIGLHLDPDGEMVRRAFQLGGDDGLWRSAPTLDRFVETVRALEALPLLDAYRATSCPTITVIADQRSAMDEEQEAQARRHVDRVRAALLAAGSEVQGIPSRHYPHVEVPALTAERFEGWVDR
jgi:pimeloyl-ACP methyl ester carboxylesterase